MKTSKCFFLLVFNLFFLNFYVFSRCTNDDNSQYFNSGPMTIQAGNIYVWARNGLLLREKPDKSSTAIAVIPFGDQVELNDIFYDFSIDSSSYFKNFNSVEDYTPNGEYLEVSWQNTIGYVFSSYLSRLKPYNAPNYLSYEDYFSSTKPFGDIVHEEIKTIVINQDTFNNGINIMYEDRGYLSIFSGLETSYYFSAYLPQVTIREAFLIAAHSLGGSEMTCKLLIDNESQLVFIPKCWAGGYYEINRAGIDSVVINYYCNSAD